VLGITSVFCLGFLTGIPAVLLGFAAKKNVPAGAPGAGAATAGIVTGFVGTFGSFASIAVTIVLLAVAVHAPPSSARGPASTPPIATPAADPHGPRVQQYGAVRVVDMNPEDERTLRQQLAEELQRASLAHETILVQTTAQWCPVCTDVDHALHDARMQRALVGVTVVRVDVDEFESDLRALRLWQSTVPWFYKLDAQVRPVDAISSDEWGDAVPSSMAPVLKAFANGTLTARRQPSPIGGMTL
jgi:hypothetical protein